MVETSTLLSLLQFVALAAPAIAILMQVTQEMKAADFVFHLLTSSLILIVFGGLLITYVIFTTINQPILSAGILLIFGSLVILAGALAFTTLLSAMESRQQASISNLPDFVRSLITQIGPPLLSVASIAFVYGLIIILTGDLLNEYISFGLFTSQSPLSPEMFFVIISALLAIQSLLRLIENNILPSDDFSKVSNKTFVIVFTWILGYTVFVGPVFLFGVILTEVDIWILPLSSSNILLNICYLWAGLVAVVLFAVDVDLE